MGYLSSPCWCCSRQVRRVMFVDGIKRVEGKAVSVRSGIGVLLRLELNLATHGDATGET